MTLPIPRTSPDERALRARVAQRDPAAIEWLYDSYGRALHRQACALLPRRINADEALQNVWVAVLTHAHHYDPARSPWPWLSRICLHVCLRARRPWRVLLDDEATRAATSPGADGSDDGGALPSARDAVRRALNQLSRRLREVVALRFLFGVDPREIAVLLRMSPNAVSQAVVRGLAGLRKCADAPQLARWMERLDAARGDKS